MDDACSTRPRPALASSGTTGRRCSTSWSCRSSGSIRCTTACGREALPAMAFYVIGVLGAYRLGRRAHARPARGRPRRARLWREPEPALPAGDRRCSSRRSRCRSCGSRPASCASAARGASGTWPWPGCGARSRSGPRGAPILLPLYGAIVVAAACRRHGFGWRKTETFALGYAIAAGYTLVLWMAWNFYIQHDPLYMLNYYQPVGQLVTDETFVHGQPGDPGFAFLNYGAAVVDLLGPVVAALIVVVAAGALLRGRIFHPGGVALIGGGLVARLHERPRHGDRLPAVGRPEGPHRRGGAQPQHPLRALAGALRRGRGRRARGPFAPASDRRAARAARGDGLVPAVGPWRQHDRSGRAIARSGSLRD